MFYHSSFNPCVCCFLAYWLTPVCVCCFMAHSLTSVCVCCFMEDLLHLCLCMLINEKVIIPCFMENLLPSVYVFYGRYVIPVCVCHFLEDLLYLCVCCSVIPMYACVCSVEDLLYLCLCVLFLRKSLNPHPHYLYCAVFCFHGRSMSV